MSIKNLLKNAKDLTDHQFSQKLGRLVRSSYKYKNLDRKNQKLIFDITKKYRSYLKKGRSITNTMIQNEVFKLKRNKIKLGLSDEDVKDIKEILNVLKK